MRQIEPPLIRELHSVVAELRERSAAQERHVEELRGAVATLMEPPGVLPTREYVREALHYDRETGEFRWHKRPPTHFASWRRMIHWNRKIAGNSVGRISGRGYICIDIDRRSYLAHRLAWLLVHGQPVPAEINHIDGNPSNNRIGNLRPASRPQTTAAGREHHDNRTGVKGVYLQRNTKFRAHIMHHGQRHSLGNFTTLEDAATARREAAERLQGEFARH